MEGTRTYLDGHGYGLKLERVNVSVTCSPKDYTWTYQVDHRLLLNRPLQQRDCELRFFGVGSFCGNMIPNLHALNIARVIKRPAYALLVQYFDKESRLNPTACDPRCTYNRTSTSTGDWGSSDTPWSTYRSYAVDVLKEMTKPRTTPSTVKSWLLNASLIFVSLSTSTTTGIVDSELHREDQKPTHPSQPK